MSTPTSTSTIHIQNLTFNHRNDNQPALSNVNLSLPPGSRTLLIGANGGTVPLFPFPISVQVPEHTHRLLPYFVIYITAQ